MIRSKIIKLYHSAGFLSVLILKISLTVWTYDVIGAATSNQLSEKICKNAVNYSFVESICCHGTLEEDKHLNACIKQTSPTSSNWSLVHLSRLSECLYRKRKYVKSNKKLNIERVKAEANRLYHNDTLRKNFMINMYRYCSRFATEKLNSVNEKNKSREAISQLRKPYFMYHFTCITVYSKKQCPYFIWKGKNENHKKTCIDFADECAKGIKKEE